MQKKLALLLLIAVTLTVLTISPLTSATTTQYGYTGGYGTAPVRTANVLYGFNVSTSSWAESQYRVTSGSVIFNSASSTTAMIVIVKPDLTIAGVSDVRYGSADYSYKTFTFSTNVVLDKSEGYYWLCFIANSTSYLGAQTNQQYNLQDDSNSLLYISDPTDASITTGASKNQYCIFLNLNSDLATPTPAPTVTPGTSDLWSGTWIENVIGIVLPLALILIPAFLGWKFAKAWGFFAGLNVGVILCYVYGQMIPLWGVVVMLVVDGLMLFGKLGMHD